MATRRSANLAIAFSPTFKRQTTRGTPLDASELTRAFPATPGRAEMPPAHHEAPTAFTQLHTCTAYSYFNSTSLNAGTRMKTELDAVCRKVVFT